MRTHSIERPRKSNRLLSAFSLLMMLAVSACVTAPQDTETLTPTERLQRDQAVGASLARQFEAQLKLKQDKAVLIYLHGLANQLSVSVPELKGSAVSVQVVADRGERWVNYSLPGNRIYLSAGLLKRVAYENELAAAIAVELMHLLRRHVPLRMQEGKIGSKGADPAAFDSIEGLVPSAAEVRRDVDFFSPTGIFAFPDEYFVSGVETTVKILYGAGFDPRGLVSLWSIYRSAGQKSPLEEDVLRKLTEKTRAVIAEYPPLRNPIVRSRAFLTIQKRMQGL